MKLEMKYVGLILLFLIGFGRTESKAQFSEFGLMGGVSFYLGDLNPDIPFKQVMPAGGVFYRYNFIPINITVRISVQNTIIEVRS